MTNEIIIHEEQLTPVVFESFNEVLEYVESGLAKYANIVVTDDNYKNCKEDRAKINKLRDAFKDKKKSLKNKYLLAIKDASDKLDTLTEKCDTISKNIDEGIKAIEAKRKEEKLSVLKDYLVTKVNREAPSALAGRVYWDTWLNQQTQFLNASTSLASATKTIDDYIVEVCRGFRVLNVMCMGDNDVLTIAQHAYATNGFSMEKTAEAITTYKNNKELLTKKTEQSSPLPTAVRVDDDGNNIYRATIILEGTISQLKAVRNFIDANSIKLIESKMK